MSEVQAEMFPNKSLAEVEISDDQADLVTRIEEGQFFGCEIQTDRPIQT